MKTKKIQDDLAEFVETMLVNPTLCASSPAFADGSLNTALKVLIMIREDCSRQDAALRVGKEVCALHGIFSDQALHNCGKSPTDFEPRSFEEFQEQGRTLCLRLLGDLFDEKDLVGSEA